MRRTLFPAKADDICAIIYTSGTTGKMPKGTLTFLSNRSGVLPIVIWNWTTYGPQRQPGVLSSSGLDYRTMAGFRLSSSISQYGKFRRGRRNQQQDIREIGPTMVLYNSRLWERQAGKVQAKIQRAGGLKKLIYRWFMPVGYKLADFKARKQKPGWYWRTLYIPANLLLFRPIRDSLGLPHARICYSSGATLCAEAFRFYHALNIPLKNLYGSTEAGALTGTSNENI